MITVAPCSTPADSILISPRWRLTIRCAIARPRPAPPPVLDMSDRKNRSNTRGRSSGSIPTPVSRTVMRPKPSAASAVTVICPPGWVNLTALWMTVQDRPPDPFDIDPNGDRRFRGDYPQGDAAALGERAVSRSVTSLAISPQSDSRISIRSCPASNRATSSNSIGERLQPFDLDPNLPEEGRGRGGIVPGARFERIQQRPQRRDGRAQVVRDVGDKLPPHPLGLRLRRDVFQHHQVAAVSVVGDGQRTDPDLPSPNDRLGRRRIGRGFGE